MVHHGVYIASLTLLNSMNACTLLDSGGTLVSHVACRHKSNCRIALVDMNDTDS